VADERDVAGFGGIGVGQDACRLTTTRRGDGGNDNHEQ
jgi:hypothetical protein